MCWQNPRLWTKKGAEPRSLLALASASLLAGLEARRGTFSMPGPYELLQQSRAKLQDVPAAAGCLEEKREEEGDALADLLNSVQKDPSLITGNDFEDEDMKALTDGLFD